MPHEKKQDGLSMWRLYVQNSFAALLQTTTLPHTPVMDEFVGYAKSQLPHDLEAIGSSRGLSEFEANGYLGQFLSPDDLSPAFIRTMHDIRTQTKYLHELEEVRIADAIANGNLKQAHYRAHVFFPKHSLVAKLAKRLHPNPYIPLLDLLISQIQPPDEKTMWRSLVTKGTLPQSVMDLDKSLTQDLEWEKLARVLHWTPYLLFTAVQQMFLVRSAIEFAALVGWLKGPLTTVIGKGFGNNPILSVLHQEEASRYSATSFEAAPYYKVKADILEHLVTHAHLDDRDLRKTNIALDLIHGLRVLGSSEEQIGRLIDSAKFNERTMTYPSLQKMLVAKLSPYGIDTKSKDYDTLMNCLFAKHEVELMLEQVNARNIAVESLKKSISTQFYPQ